MVLNLGGLKVLRLEQMLLLDELPACPPQSCLEESYSLWCILDDFATF